YAIESLSPVRRTRGNSTKRGPPVLSRAASGRDSLRPVWTNDTIEVRLVGRFAIRRDGAAVPDADIGSRKGRTLLKLLAVNRDRTVSADRIAEAVWEGSPPARTEESVAVLVSRLRRTFGPDRIAGGRDGYRLVTGAA